MAYDQSQKALPHGAGAHTAASSESSISGAEIHGLLEAKRELEVGLRLLLGVQSTKHFTWGGGTGHGSSGHSGESKGHRNTENCKKPNTSPSTSSFLNRSVSSSAHPQVRSASSPRGLGGGVDCSAPFVASATTVVDMRGDAPAQFVASATTVVDMREEEEGGEGGHEAMSGAEEEELNREGSGKHGNHARDRSDDTRENTSPNRTRSSAQAHSGGKTKENPEPDAHGEEGLMGWQIRQVDAFQNSP